MICPLVTLGRDPISHNRVVRVAHSESFVMVTLTTITNSVSNGSGHYLRVGGGFGNPKIPHTQNLPPPRPPRTTFLPPPPQKLCTEILPPPSWCINDVYLFQGMMLANGKCKVGMTYDSSISKYIKIFYGILFLPQGGLQISVH